MYNNVHIHRQLGVNLSLQFYQWCACVQSIGSVFLFVSSLVNHAICCRVVRSGTDESNHTEHM